MMGEKTRKVKLLGLNLRWDAEGDNPTYNWVDIGFDWTEVSEKEYQNLKQFAQDFQKFKRHIPYQDRPDFDLILVEDETNLSPKLGKIRLLIEEAKNKEAQKAEEARLKREKAASAKVEKAKKQKLLQFKKLQVELAKEGLIQGESK
jgi:hypothetical protein